MAKCSIFAHDSDFLVYLGGLNRGSYKVKDELEKTAKIIRKLPLF